MTAPDWTEFALGRYGTGGTAWLGVIFAWG